MVNIEWSLYNDPADLLADVRDLLVPPTQLASQHDISVEDFQDITCEVATYARAKRDSGERLHRIQASAIHKLVEKYSAEAQMEPPANAG